MPAPAPLPASSVDAAPLPAALASGHVLVRPASPEDWACLHGIRRETLFVGRTAPDDGHETDDRAPGHHPLLLCRGGLVIGVVRIDEAPDWAILRRLAILSAHQRQGHGRALLLLCESMVQGLGHDRLVVNAAHDAVPFYLANGYRLETWDQAQATPTSQQMTKVLTPMA